MSGPTRLLLFASVLAALTTPILVGRPSASVWNLPASWAQLEAERERQRELGVRGDIVLRRIQVKREIARRVIEGRATVSEAAARYRAMHSEPRDAELLRMAHPGCSDEEAARRNVLVFVQETLGDRPWTGLVMTRLETELEEGTRGAPDIEGMR